MKNYFEFEKRPFDNPWLDMLRTLAVALVLLRHGHLAQIGYSTSETGFIGNFFLNGWVGVNLFFVLSGYLITSSLLRTKEQYQKIIYKDYILQRALRILPAYYAVLLLVVIGAFPLYSIDLHNIGWRLFYHLILFQDYMASNINVVFWSLGVEEKFYLIAPLIILLLRKAKTRVFFFVIILAILCVSPILRYFTMQYHFHIYGQQHGIDYFEFFRWMRAPFHVNLEPLIIGVAIAMVNHRKMAVFSPAHLKIIFGLFFILMVTGLGSQNLMAEITIGDVIWEPLIIALVFGGLVFTASHLTFERVPLEFLFRVIARLSYTLYLVHYPLIQFSLALSDTFGNTAPIFWSAFILLSISMSLLIHFAVEKPFLLLRKKISARKRARLQKTNYL
jgi:peptidoglycan/LPS O-acetylase OafA/YrhL